MPWKASSVVEQRTRFILEYERDEHTMSELCEIYGISRETGYYWLRRFRQPLHASIANPAVALRPPPLICSEVKN